jgi:hypothetical protein
MGALTPNRQITTMTQATVNAHIQQTLDIH